MVESEARQFPARRGEGRGRGRASRRVRRSARLSQGGPPLLDRVASAAGPVVTGFTGGGFRVGDRVYHGLLITPERVEGWRPPALGALAEADIAALLAGDPLPEFLLLGTGRALALPPRGFVAALEARGIGVEPMDSRAAARAWGVLRAEGRRIVGALYPLD